MLRRQAQHGDAMLHHGLHRHEMHGIDLVRHLEEHAGFVRRPPRRRERRPGAVARRKIESGGTLRLPLHPARDVAGIALLGQRLAHERRKLRRQRRTVEDRRLLRRDTLHRAALHEEALHGVERRQIAVPSLQRPHFRSDAEETGDEILEMRGQIDQELGMRLRFQRGGIPPCAHQTVVQLRVAISEMGDEGCVDACQPVAGVEIREGKPMLQCEAAGHVGGGSGGGRARSNTEKRRPCIWPRCRSVQDVKCLRYLGKAPEKMRALPAPQRPDSPPALARSSTAFSSTAQPMARSSGLASSISLWLMPPTQGTKIMAVGATRAM